MLTEKFLTKKDRDSWKKIRNELKEEFQNGEISQEVYELSIRDWKYEFRYRAFLTSFVPIIAAVLAAIITNFIWVLIAGLISSR
ncbi:hypothetical protein BMS77_09075 [Leuconostoc pseudomesenteroides]|uniref:Uncharacterized protein n=1 Tax=Leuconostoc pseudomesenteroides TaxID=33968 RepID=A0A1X0VC50_LEUPS|nr:hypothetical protein BMS77_09075 [Leuconostoc pseudomesenteroides]OQJ75360.1 hypothetical protein BMS83_08475 [Leuconostoc pseudomesenteroides]OQJ76129.1 hypothetical protein BMS82_08325 [Leuconostoc pseudomesenteroides]ORI35982.1 hypothetical protein BMR88_08500 [Leuconostoc pseudomesenteroides]ORI44613.1 hypothetical protein BMR94_08660 [Leuconostoc pseudomesenteroides]